MAISGKSKPNSVNWNSLSYVILCYGKMRQKIGPFTIVDFWKLRDRQPDIPSKLKKYFTFLESRGFLSVKNNKYSLTLKGEHEILQCAKRRMEAIDKQQSRNARIGSAHRWTERDSDSD